MSRFAFFVLAMFSLCLPWCAGAQAPSTITVQGVVHDPDHRVVPGALVQLRSSNAAAGAVIESTLSNADGEFSFTAAPGNYVLVATAAGFQPRTLAISVATQGNPVFHLELQVGSASQQITVSAREGRIDTQTSTTQTTVTATQIQQAPGADRANSLAMITDFVPGATVVHDMLHVRGGHQESWFLDGIPVLNTNIASNVGPLVNPANIASLQVQTGGYSAAYDDRGFGYFNAITPSGFDQNNQAQLIASYGNYGQTNDQLSFGSHTDALAYYASVDGNFSHLGLYAPSSTVVHDNAAGLGVLLSGLYNASAANQFRFVASLRGDNYQIPNTAEQQAAGIADRDLERDNLIGITWNHTSSNGILVTSSPFYHFDRADYAGGPSDTPFVLNNNRRSNYYGDLTSVAIPWGKHSISTGVYLWDEHDDTSFNLRAHPGTAIAAQRFAPSANLEAAFLEDSYQVTPWLNLNGGVHLTRYAGLVRESAADPRVGAALRSPAPHGWANWTLHGYYAAYYQEPPLDTISGPLLAYALAQGVNFVPLHGERDRQWDAGLDIPFRGWSLGFDRFRTESNNFLDHDELGNSDIFLPLTDDHARIWGNEISLHSPRLWRRASLSVAYSNQTAQARGPITGGLIGDDLGTGYFYLDHDQRNTLSVVLNTTLPGNSWASAAYNFGSGFLDGNGPAHLSANSVLGVSAGKSFGESLSLSLNVTNLTNARYLLDNSNTFGGTHWEYPRQIYVQLRWRGKY